MSSVLLTVLLLTGGVDFGGRIAGAYPAGGLSRFHSTSAMLGACAGYTTGPVRFEVAYDYLNLPGINSTPARLVLQMMGFAGAWQFVQQSDWGIEARVGSGYALGQRDFGSGRETGNAPTGDWGIGFFQLAGSSRLSVMFIHTVLFEDGPTTNHLLTLRAGVAYAP